MQNWNDSSIHADDFPPVQGPLVPDLDLDLEMSALNEIIVAVKNAAGNEYLYFDKPVYAKHSTFCSPFVMHGCCVSPENRLFVMDGSQQWHEVEDRPEDTRILMKLHRYFHLD